MHARWEIGSEFHWMGLPPAPCVSLPTPLSWYLLGRHAVIALLRSLPQRSRRLWIPSYFCGNVAAYWAGFMPLAYYADDPRRAEPDWATLKPAADDMVVAVNYFGVRSGEPWWHWRERNQCLLLDDHSHDPVAGWALRSRADYAFSSLRKTMPAPDGAILWSPRGLPLPAASETDASASALKLAAMIWKREYLQNGAAAETKASFRQWQLAGEQGFDQSAEISAATSFSQEYLAPGVPVKWRRQRAANVRRLLHQLRSWPVAEPLFESWPRDGGPLAAVFRFHSTEERDRIRKKLEEFNVYCPVHWPAAEQLDPAMRQLSATLLSIPTDQRYRARDMDRVAGALREQAL